MENQQEIAFQRDLFLERASESIYQSSDREDVYRASVVMENQVNGARKQGRVFTGNLMQLVCTSANIKRSYSQVKRNKGVS